MLEPLRQVKKAAERWDRSRRMTAIQKLLADRTPPDTVRSERDFAELQRRYPPRQEYGYDQTSLFARAAERGANLLRTAGAGDKGFRILDLGAGDGMLCALLAAAGHEVAICDLEDWRAEPAKHLRFVQADCSVEIPLPTNSFDVVCSFNSFEHFGDPARAFAEALRIVKPGGFLRFDFNPLYCSPWGLHAYRSLRMPYPQFLFSEEFIHRKLAEIGIWDLGQQRTELQSLNKWRPSQFTSLWSDGSCDLMVSSEVTIEGHLDLIVRFPEAFRGRGLTFRDVTCAGLSVAIRKKESDVARRAMQPLSDRQMVMAPAAG